MKNIKLNIPVIVQNLEVNGVPNYHIKPVFLRHPVATNRRFDLAIRQFQKEIRYYFKGYEFSTSNSASLLWFLFSPELQFQHVSFSAMVGSQLITGLVSVAAFELKNNLFICLPNFDYFLFIAEKDGHGKVNIEANVERVVRQLLKNFKQEFGKDFDFNPYFSNKKEFITSVDVSVNIQFDKFKFEKDPSNLFFSRLTGNSDFNGAVEIEKVGQDLNNLYPDELQQAFLQDNLVKRIHEIVYGKESAPIVLVGKTGVGKHTIVHEVIRRFLDNYYNFPKQKGPKSRVWQLDPTRVISGMSIVGMWQKRLESIIKFVRQPHAIHPQSDKLLIDNVVALTRIGKSSQNNMTMADLLKPYIEKRQLHTILLATPEEWKILQEQNRRFSDLFQVIRLQEPDIETTTRIILEKRKKLEADNNCEISVKAIEQLLSIQRNYLKHEALPGSILKLLEKLCVKYRFKSLDAHEVRQEFEDFSGLNNAIFDTGIQFEENQVKEEIQKRLVGQETAVQALADVVHLIKAKLTNPDKPNASFLFIGPTGVGKTQAAKVLAKYLLGNEDYLLRFDMNEFIDEYSVQRLIGDFYNPEGILTGKVRYRPFGVILLDEIEKAHPKVHDILLQVLDDGRLTDSLGRTVDFTNTIIIMTSNVGAKEVSAQLGFSKTENSNKAIYRKSVEQRFRPEFVNRIDNIIIFNPLQLEHIFGIARLQIKELLQRDGFVRRTTILNISNDALEWVARRGYNAQMGGRALKRQIEQDLTSLSAEQLLNTRGDHPIILEIKIANERLVPDIQPLEFATALPTNWLPQLPSEKAGKRFFKSLLTQLERIELSIRRMEEHNDSSSNVIVINDKTSDGLNWQYYNFKEKVSSSKQKIQTLMLGFRDNYFAEGPAIPLRFKASELYPKSDYSSRGVRENIRDRLFQKEALVELEEGHQFGNNKFDSLQTEFIDCFLDVQFIRLFAKDFLKNRREKIELEIKSCINGSGETEVQFLIEHYVKLFQALELSYTLDKEKGFIEADGHSLFGLLKGEAGVHLFYQSHQNPLPIQVNLRTITRKRNLTIKHYEVIRIYDSNRTMLDLRTQFTNDFHIRYPEFKVLLYAGMSK